MPKLEQLAARKAAIKEQYQRDATITAQAARITQLEAQLAEWEKLQSPSALHQNLLRGLPARLEPKDFLHLAGEKYQAMDSRIDDLELLAECNKLLRQGWKTEKKRETERADKAEARIAELEKDSARYRALRDELINMGDKPRPIEAALLKMLQEVERDRGPEANPASAEFDAAIDAVTT